jgi:hypothetical protein
MPQVVMVLIMLFVASPATELRAGQVRGLLDNLPVLAAGAPKQCCRVCKKGKSCGNGCISQERQCTKGAGCACDAESNSAQPRVQPEPGQSTLRRESGLGPSHP